MVAYYILISCWFLNSFDFALAVLSNTTYKFNNSIIRYSPDNQWILSGPDVIREGGALSNSSQAEITMEFSGEKIKVITN